MVVVKCPAPGCSYQTEDVSEDIVGQLFTLHALSHAQTHVPTSRGPKLTRPTIDIGVDQETWNAFARRWDTFRAGSDISVHAAPVQLFQCASEALGDMLLKTDPHLTSKPVEDVMQAMQYMAVIPVARGVSRAELFQMAQAADEPIRTFAARVRGKAETCLFQTATTCGACKKPVSADYTEEVIRDVLLAGIADVDIRREALGMPDIQDKSTNDVVALIESREMARNATPITSVSTMSSYRRSKHPNHDSVNSGPPPSSSSSQPHSSSRQVAKTVPCPDCGSHFSPFRERPKGGQNRVPYKKCLACWRSSKGTKTAKHLETVTVKAIETMESDLFDSHVTQVSGIETAEERKTLEAKVATETVNSCLSDNKMNHVLGIGSTNRHPKTSIQIGFAYRKNEFLPTVEVIADTGAMSNVWGLNDYKAAGFSVKDLQPTKTKIKAANGQFINILGEFNALFKGTAPNNEDIVAIACVYVSDNASGFYLSRDTMVKLYIIDDSFPTVGLCKINEINEGLKMQVGDVIGSLDSGKTCECPQRSVVPERPKSLPFPPTPGNIPKMKEWLINRYASSTFNTCPHRALPCMSGPPMEIHVDATAKPKVCNKPAQVPLHWQQRVYDDLLRDEALGVIERVPSGVPVTWCHRMVVTRKHDGTPRRTVDLSPLNKYCKRETFPAEAPFHLARRVPGHTWKTVTDAWNGYHSVPIRESDRHLTTFITPFGRWRYTRAPQGFLSSGDSYNQRFDSIIADFGRKERCVDDTIHYDEDLETHWWRTIDFLSMMGAAGAVMNSDKFQFAQRQVDFAGFRIAETSIEPLPKYLDAIRTFPTPKSTKDIRSWFGLVNQVSNYAQLRDYMEIFRPFLCPKYKFFWSQVLDDAFEKSKMWIIESIKEGVEIFDMKKATCLRPDWSTRGIGYFLLQKHCTCDSDVPDCCLNGWKITLAGSRFLKGAEQRYAAIEGEALAISWGLEQTKYFTQGCQDLMIVTDHKPLTKIFGDRTLDEISNTRLFRLKQRTLPWRFQIKHLPGRTNLAADATSRYPAPAIESNVSTLTDGDELEGIIAAAISKDVKDITAISWELIAEETVKDETLTKVMKAIHNGFTDNDPFNSEYQRYHESLYVIDGVVMYQDRVVVPTSLRKAILDNLHSAHQGVSSMQLRAQAIVFWPGMTLDIQQIRARCRECNRNAPSQAHVPSELTSPPSTPFEQIFADFFEFGGHHYLTIGCRLAGWPEIWSTPSGSAWSGARGLISCLRRHFATFGVPEELSSDGGPEFTASLTKEFLEKWGVKHRISSAYYPQSNGRAEVAVKTAKRLLRANVGPNGSLNTDELIKALLQYRNTPDPDCNVSPAQIIFGRPLRDSLSFTNRLEKYTNPHIRPMWREAWASKEEALRTRMTKSTESLNEHSKPLPPLKAGERCFVQNQTGNHPTKWDRTGTIVEQGQHNQYLIKIDGSGRLTKRNRQFIRTFKPASATIEAAPKLLDCKSKENPRSNGTQSENETCQAEPEKHTTSSTPSHTFPLDDGPMVSSPIASHEPLEPPRERQKVPAMLRRLLPHNSAGQAEGIVAQEHGGRRSRRLCNL